MNCLYATSLNLRFLTMQGEPLKQAERAKPFILEVLCDDESAEKPVIKGLEQVAIVEESTSMTLSISGSRKNAIKRYTYVIRALKPGMLTLGPAYIQNGAIQSATIQINVGESVRSAEEDVLLEVVIEQKSGVIGEKVPYSIRLLYDTQVPVIHSVEQSSHDDITLEAAHGSFQGTCEKEGKKYKSIEWRGTFIPHTTGTLIIPAVKMYIEEKKGHNSSLMSIFFGGKKRLLVSAPLKFLVEPLPPYSEKVHAVGQFDTFALTIDKKSVRQNEAFSLVLSIGGKGNMKEIPVHELCMSSAFKWYFSSQTCAQQGIGEEKRYEYVVQALEPGIQEIPAQQFTYYEPETKTYKTLRTQPIILEVLAAAPVKNIKPSEQEPITDEFNEQKHEETIENQESIIQHLHIPYVIFMLLLMVPGCLVSGYKGSMRFVAYRKKQPRIIIKRLFIQAHKKLTLHKKLVNAQAVHVLFQELFYELAQTQLITDKDINKVPQQLFLNDASLHQKWNKYCDILVIYAFGSTVCQLEEWKYLMQESEEWLCFFSAALIKKLAKKL